jgi:hypothetical protein
MQSKLINIAGHGFTASDFGLEEDEYSFLLGLEAGGWHVKIVNKVADGPDGGYFDIVHNSLSVGAISGMHLQAIQDILKNGKDSDGTLR